MYRVLEYVERIDGNEKEFNLTDSLSEKDYEILRSHNRDILKIESRTEYLKLLNEEYEEYTSVIDNKNSTITQIIRAINNYFSGYKGFLDRWETYIKRELPDEISTYFKLLGNEIYDRCFEYRFIYNLRNYAQHAGNPVSRIYRSIDNDTEVFLNKESFISSHKKMQASFRKELQRIHLDEIDIHASIIVVQKELESMQNKLIMKIVESTEGIIYSANYIREFYEKYSKYEGHLSIITQQNFDTLISGTGTATLNPYPINHKMAIEILKGASFKFKFKGRYVGEGDWFPVMHPTDNALQIPKFHSGIESVTYENIKWERIMKRIKVSWAGDYDRLFEVYMPSGLSMEDYKEVIRSLEEQEKEELFNM